MHHIDGVPCDGPLSLGWIDAHAARLRLNMMEFKVSELEREPIEFDLELPPGAVDFGEEAEQEGIWRLRGGPR